jgi:hypothetical protein
MHRERELVEFVVVDLPPVDRRVDDKIVDRKLERTPKLMRRFLFHRHAFFDTSAP